MNRLIYIRLIFLLSLTGCIKLNLRTTISSLQTIATNSICITNASLFSGGTGSLNDPFLICNLSDLEMLDNKLSGSDYDSFKDKFYYQVNDIDLNSGNQSFLPLGVLDVSLNRNDILEILTTAPTSKPFQGTYNGNNKIISNMTFQSAGIKDHNGFFSMIGSSGVVKNIIFENPLFNLSNSIVNGVVTGFSSGRIQNIQIKNLNANLDQSIFFGGVCGLLINGQEISDINVDGVINGSSNVTYSSITDSLDTTTSAAAGISAAIITIDSSITTQISDVTSLTSIDIGGSVAGVAHLVAGPVVITNARNEGNLKSYLEAAGAIGITMKADIFGASGLAMPIGNFLFNSGNVLVTGTQADTTGASGLIGLAENFELNDSGNTGVIVNEHRISGYSAGIAGRVAQFHANRIFNSGDIHYINTKFEKDGITPAQNGDVGGLVGYFGDGGSGVHALSINNCYVSGSITTQNNQNDISGIIADLWDLQTGFILDINNCYVAASFRGGNGGDSGRGAVFGQINIRNDNSPIITLSNLYWNQSIAPNKTAALIDSSHQVHLFENAGGSLSAFTSLTTAQMQDSTNFNFDFTSIWNEPTPTTFPTFR
jgi:hypothetical protein